MSLGAVSRQNSHALFAVYSAQCVSGLPAYEGWNSAVRSEQLCWALLSTYAKRAHPDRGLPCRSDGAHRAGLPQVLNPRPRNMFKTSSALGSKSVGAYDMSCTKEGLEMVGVGLCISDFKWERWHLGLRNPVRELM